MVQWVVATVSVAWVLLLFTFLLSKPPLFPSVNAFFVFLTGALGETTLEGLPPRSGQAVRMRKSAIEQFARQREMSFCWLCQLTGYHREHQGREFTSFADQRIYGASRHR